MKESVNFVIDLINQPLHTNRKDWISREEQSRAVVKERR